MKTKRFYQVLVAGIFILSSCEKIVENVDLPEARPKLVVFSYINPGADTIFAQVSLSRPITEPGGYDEPSVSNAMVSIHQTGSPGHAFEFDPEFNRYFVVLDSSYLQAGSIYQIQASTPDGKAVDATCTLPIPNTSLRITNVDKTESEEETRYRFRIEFDDIPGKPDYYRIIPIAIMQYGWDNNVQIMEQYAEILYGNEYIDVKDRDGETFVVDAGFTAWHYFGGAEKFLGMKIYLLSTDEHYYHFHRSLENYEPDNPFSEPTIVYTNVNNGLGVFAGFNPFVLEYWLEDE
jgi:hypothetical protein